MLQELAAQAEVLALLEQAFPEVPAAYFGQIITLDPELPRGQTFARREGGELVATAHVFQRRVRWGDSGIIRVGVVGHVATHPEYRGRGFAGAVLQEAMEAMRFGGCDLGLIFTGIQDFYERWGWVPKPYTVVTVPTAEIALSESPVYTVRTLTESDLPAVAAVYRREKEPQCGLLIRSDTYWVRHRIWNATRGLEEQQGFYVALRPGSQEIVAYLRSARAVGEPKIAVFEACSVVGADAYPDLLRAVLLRAKAEGIPAIETDLPPGHLLAGQIVGAAGAVSALRHGPMVHPLGRARVWPSPAEAEPFFWRADWC
ncbi:MAG: GNAT family N-acetyltransferase [Mycobacterium leprae]